MNTNINILDCACVRLASFYHVIACNNQQDLFEETQKNYLHFPIFFKAGMAREVEYFLVEETTTHLTNIIVDSMVADDVATHGARSLTTVILN